MSNFDEAMVHLSDQAKDLSVPGAHIEHCEVVPHDDDPGVFMVLVEIDNGHTLATTVRDSDMSREDLCTACVSAVSFGLAMGAA